ncbi:MAG: hypothetical protein WA979_03875 [Pacificimonas sp.]
MDKPVDDLTALIRADLSLSVDPRISAFAARIAAGHSGAQGVLFYGSCLRENKLDGLMLDFYLIVADYGRAFDKAWLARWNHRLPPNVFYAEHEGLAAKYAVMDVADFLRDCRGEGRSISVFARFAQPARLVWDGGNPDSIVRAVASAAPTLLKEARPLLSANLTVPQLWRESFALTYAAELRAERTGRNAGIAEAWPDYYAGLTRPALRRAQIEFTDNDGELTLTEPADRAHGKRHWARRRRWGKVISAARLVKASATFDGGIDYLAWKINRHAKTDIEISAWQRRHPVLAGIGLLPKLIASGAVK